MSIFTGGLPINDVHFRKKVHISIWQNLATTSGVFVRPHQLCVTWLFAVVVLLCVNTRTQTLKKI